MTIRHQPVRHDARPLDGHTYRLRLTGGGEHLAVARSSYSGASVVFAVIDDDGQLTGDGYSEFWPDLERVERVTSTPAPGLADAEHRLAREDLI